MIQVTFQGVVYTCTRAVKGVNYIRLYDGNNIQTAAFEEITDFSLFTIKGGEWEQGTSANRATASAIRSGPDIVLTINEKVVVEDGLLISFRAPDSSFGCSSIKIGSNNYEFLDTRGVSVGGLVDCFVKGAQLEVVLSEYGRSQVAYLQTVGSSCANWHESSDHPGCYFILYADGEKEWINPPSTNGVMYPTIERFQESPVVTLNKTFVVDSGDTVEIINNSFSKIVELTGIMEYTVEPGKWGTKVINWGTDLEIYYEFRYSPDLSYVWKIKNNSSSIITGRIKIKFA